MSSSRRGRAHGTHAADDRDPDFQAGKSWAEASAALESAANFANRDIVLAVGRALLVRSGDAHARPRPFLRLRRVASLFHQPPNLYEWSACRLPVRRPPRLRP